MNLPGASTAKISDLIPKVQAALQNRADVTESQSNPEMRPSAWLRDSLREITANNPFEELRQPNPPNVIIGPGKGIGGSNYKYKVSQFIASGDDVTLMEDPVIFLDPPTNSVPHPMDYLTPKAIAPYFVLNGIPYNYTRFGDQFWFGVQPQQNYTVFLPYQARHPFNDDNLPVSQVGVPPDWFDIVAYAAAERGAIALRWNDQATYLHQVLHGDPKDPTALGLIEKKLMQQDRDRRLSTIAVTPVVQRY
jgi:hypothetical protein